MVQKYSSLMYTHRMKMTLASSKYYLISFYNIALDLFFMGGDFNCVMSNMLDRQPSSKAALSQMSKMLKYQCMEAGLVDLWRSKFPGSRDFTFYSSRHESYSRIDYFFTSKKDQHRISDIKILPITLSDHVPIELKWDIGHRPSSKQWRLNASLLNDRI